MPKHYFVFFLNTNVTNRADENVAARFKWLTQLTMKEILTELHYSVWLHNMCVSALCYSSLIMTSIQVDRSSDNSGLFVFVLNLFVDKFKSFNTGTSFPVLMQNTDQLSASLKTDKTGVWHWNSSQRIKGSILPPQSVTLHCHCDTSPWGDWC